MRLAVLSARGGARVKLHVFLGSQHPKLRAAEAAVSVADTPIETVVSHAGSGLAALQAKVALNSLKTLENSMIQVLCQGKMPSKSGR